MKQIVKTLTKLFIGPGRESDSVFSQRYNIKIRL